MQGAKTSDSKQRPFRAGDRVKVGTLEGVLQKYQDGLYLSNGEVSEYFSEDGALIHRSYLGPVLTLIEAAPEKPVRREFLVCGSYESMLIVDKFPEGDQKFTVREVLPGDIGPITKDEARTWVIKAWADAMKNYKSPTGTMRYLYGTPLLGEVLGELLKGLGLAEEEKK